MGKKHQAVDTFCEVAGVDSSQEFEAVHATDDVELPDERLQKETANDSTLCHLKKTIQDGWPERRHDAPADTRPYFDFRDELVAENGVLFRSQRCIIPTTLRKEVSKNILSTHMGVGSTIRCARDHVFGQVSLN